MTSIKPKVLITGSSGFLGRNLMKALSNLNFDVYETTRYQARVSNRVIFLDLASNKEFAIQGFDVVVHLAAIAHKKQLSDDDFSSINFKATNKLASACANANVKQFIFLSSIGVNGTSNNSPFNESDVAAPINEYARSKLNAENAIASICKNSDMRYVVIRPPLIYGHNAPGNIDALVKAMHWRIPFPFKSITNKRNFCHIENVTSFISLCILNWNKNIIANETFLICDDLIMTTSDFVNEISRLHGYRALLFRFPVTLLYYFLPFISKDLVDSLLLDLQVSNDKAKKIIGWKPLH